MTYFTSSVVQRQMGEQVEIGCAAQAFPLPQFRCVLLMRLILHLWLLFGVLYLILTVCVFSHLVLIWFSFECGTLSLIKLINYWSVKYVRIHTLRTFGEQSPKVQEAGHNFRTEENSLNSLNSLEDLIRELWGSPCSSFDKLTEQNSMIFLLFATNLCRKRRIFG